MDKDRDLIDELIRILSEKELSEINFEEKEFKIKIKKDLVEEVKEEITETEIVEEIKEDVNIKDIKSANIGKFYFYDKDGKAIISIGQSIKAGQTIGYISTVGIKTPIKSKIAGTIEDILLKNGEATDYGKILIRVRQIAD
ncbi:biotin/lipoyl-containing protein [Fusobacterium sp.]|uniref:biotin/lipoyl-containing protein n=1 Tax=Fusobacterium sp. TaxID=68766 RepID=UPI00261A934B|nr:biotin/lipoyl-containing protein [Fusobacterium sp.]